MAILVAMATPAAAAGPGLNFSNDKSPNPEIVENELVVAEHDLAAMDHPLEYYDDAGEVDMLPATINDSQTTPVGVRWDKMNATQYRLFPRISGESGNDATWTKVSDWSTSTSDSTNVTPSVTDADMSGIERVNFSTSGMGSGDTATATFGANVSITSDANKRVLTFVGNVDTLASGATIEVRAVESDGDYRYAEINTSKNANANDVIANGTGNGFVFQERLSDLTLAGSGDGSFDAIDKVEIVAADADVDVKIAGLDLDTKSTFELGEIERDTDGDGELETTVITDYYEGGVANLTSLDSLGETYDSTEIVDLHVYDVQYQFSDLSDMDEFDLNWSSADAYTYPQKLEMYADLEVPSAIDLSHGSLSLEFDQGLPNGRYVELEVASGADTTTDFGNVSDSSYTGYTGSLSGTDSTTTLVNSASSDTNYRVHMIVLFQDEEVENVRDSAAAMGPTQSSGGGFFSTIWGQLTTVIGSVLGTAMIARKLGGN